MLTLYRRALRLRRTEPGFGDGPLTWLPRPTGVLAFAREDGLVCVVNLGADRSPCPAHESVLLASGPLEGDGLPLGHRRLATGLRRRRAARGRCPGPGAATGAAAGRREGGRYGGRPVGLTAWLVRPARPSVRSPVA